MLKNLKKFISNLDMKKEQTLWGDYSENNTYKSHEEGEKKRL